MPSRIFRPAGAAAAIWLDRQKPAVLLRLRVCKHQTPNSRHVQLACLLCADLWKTLKARHERLMTVTCTCRPRLVNERRLERCVWGSLLSLVKNFACRPRVAPTELRETVPPHTLKDTRQTGSLRGHSRGAARTRLNLSILQTPRHVTKSARTPRPTPRRLRSPQGPAEPRASDRDTKTPHMTRIDKHRAPTHTAQGSRLTPVTSILVGRHPCNGARESTERPPASPRPRAAGCTACAAPRSLLSQRARGRHRVHAGVRPGWPTPQGGPLLRGAARGGAPSCGSTRRQAGGPPASPRARPASRTRGATCAAARSSDRCGARSASWSARRGRACT